MNETSGWELPVYVNCKAFRTSLTKNSLKDFIPTFITRGFIHLSIHGLYTWYTTVLKQNYSTIAFSHNTVGHFEALLLCNCIFFHPFIHFLLWVMFLLSWIAELWIRSHWSWIRIRIGVQHFTWIRIQSGSRVLMTKNWRKKNRWKIFWSKIAIYLCPSNRRKLQPWKRTSSTQKM